MWGEGFGLLNLKPDREGLFYKFITSRYDPQGQ